jgi:hypothetical protein
MAAINYEVTIKNHCTPQEYITENSRWYLDSKVGTKMTGTDTITLSTSRTYAASTTLSASGASPVSVGATDQDFVYIENLGLLADGTTASAADVLISLNGDTATDYRIKISPGEAFSARLGASNGGANNVYMKTEDAAVQTVKIFRGT